jgi:hypothetical protein
MNLSPQQLAAAQKELFQAWHDNPALAQKLQSTMQHAVAVPPADQLWAVAKGAFLTSDFLMADQSLGKMAQLLRQKGGAQGHLPHTNSTIHSLEDVLLFRSAVRRISGHDADAEALGDMAAEQALAQTQAINSSDATRPSPADCGDTPAGGTASVVSQLVSGLLDEGFVSIDTGIFDSGVLKSAAAEAAQLLAGSSFVNTTGLKQLRVALAGDGLARDVDSGWGIDHGHESKAEASDSHAVDQRQQAAVAGPHRVLKRCDKQMLHVEEEWRSHARQGNQSWRESGLFAIQSAMKRLILGVNRCARQAHVPLESQLAFFSPTGTKYSVHRDTQTTTIPAVGERGAQDVVDRSITLIMYLNGPEGNALAAQPAQRPAGSGSETSHPGQQVPTHAGQAGDRPWDAADGGELLIYPRHGVVRRFSPVMGRLVAYWSSLEHEVTTNWRPRFSFTVWSSTAGSIRRRGA